MSLNPFKSKKIEPHWQMLGTLFLVLHKIRIKGLMAIESDIMDPENSPLFNILAEYDKSNLAVYTALLDTLRMMTGGNLNVEEMNGYMVNYGKTTDLSEMQKPLFETMRLTLLAALQGHAPRVAVEFGRQGIPAKLKPSFSELDKFIDKLRFEDVESVKTREQVESALDQFYASLEPGN